MEVTEHTTREEADEMCNKRYGNEAWTNFGHSMLGLPPSGGASEDRWRFAACAMGNYHCDVFYCRVNYCQDPKYIAAFSHMTPKDPLRPVDGQETSSAFF